MTAAAFSAVLGPWGRKNGLFLADLFAVAAIIGWSFYGEQSLSYLVLTEKRHLNLSAGFPALLPFWVQ